MTDRTLDLLVSPVKPDAVEHLDVPHTRPEDRPLIDLVGGTIVDDAGLDIVEWFGGRLHEALMRHAVDASSPAKGSR